MKMPDGWSITKLARNQAPNFGGIETWWECELRNLEGKTVFATSHDRAKAIQKAISYINPPKVVTPVVVDPDMPF